MGPFHLCLALGPVSIYLLLIGRINLARRAFVTTGARDVFTLAIATAGYFFAGPMDLFMPEGAVSYLGPWIWLPPVALYVLCSLLIALLLRPRLLIYNISSEQLRPVLDKVATDLDADRTWAGGSLLMPNLGIQLVVETALAMRNVQLTAVGSPHQDLNGWRQLEASLRRALRTVEVAPNPRGVSFVVFGLIMAVMVLVELNRQPEAVAQAVDQFLRR